MSSLPTPESRPLPCSEEVELEGHIIDSLILPKVLDEITSLEGDYELRDVQIGHGRRDPSRALLIVRAATDEQLETILTAIGQHGAVPVHQQDCRLEPADMDGRVSGRLLLLDE